MSNTQTQTDENLRNDVVFTGEAQIDTLEIIQVIERELGIRTEEEDAPPVDDTLRGEARKNRENAREINERVSQIRSQVI